MPRCTSPGKPSLLPSGIPGVQPGKPLQTQALARVSASNASTGSGDLRNLNHRTGPGCSARAADTASAANRGGRPGEAARTPQAGGGAQRPRPRFISRTHLNMRVDRSWITVKPK